MNLSINIPDNIFFSINETEQNLKNMLKEKLVLELYKSSKITLSQGAKMLSMDIYDFMNFLSKNDTPVINDYDIEEELNIARKILK